MADPYLQFLFCCALCLAVIGYFRREENSHRHNLMSIGLRIHVNGTRGKSSVTRLIAAGLRAGGRRVVAKTTGSAARIVLPDGAEQPLARRGPANIRELISFIKTAARLEADTVVVECMAVRPELQWFSEHRLLKSHIGVITNVRYDHEDVMGQGLASIAAGLVNTVPAGGQLVVGTAALPLLEAAGAAAIARTVCAAAENTVPAECLRGFDYEVIAENVALALKVCELAGVDRATAIRGMRQALPDSGNLTVRYFSIGGKTVRLINALAANDPQSTLLLWGKYAGHSGPETVIVLNCRADRKYRTLQLCRALCGVHQGFYAISGDTAFAGRQLRKAGIAAAAIIRLAKKTGIWQQVCACLSADNVTIFAAGNLHGWEELNFGQSTGVEELCTSSLRELQ